MVIMIGFFLSVWLFRDFEKIFCVMIIKIIFNLEEFFKMLSCVILRIINVRYFKWFKKL